MPKPKPTCETVLPWLRANLGPRCLAPLTSTDAKALAAAVQIVELYAYDRNEMVAAAFGLVVERMQLSTRQLAYHSIAHVMDWSNRPELWAAAELPRIENLLRCSHE